MFFIIFQQLHLFYQINIMPFRSFLYVYPLQVHISKKVYAFNLLFFSGYTKITTILVKNYDIILQTRYFIYLRRRLKMIIIKNGTLERINDWKDNSIYVLADFDRTITVGNSESSWSILSKSNLVPKEYVEERQILFNYYRPFELNESLSYETKNKLMTEWWNKHIGLFIKYQLSEEVINTAAKNPNVMSFRKGAKEFLKSMRNRNIPVIIISAGIGNFIEEFLIQNNCYFENIYIVSNFLKFKNGIAAGVSDNVIHSSNKNEISLPPEIKKLIENRKNIILLGDSISDIQMAREDARKDALKIGFLDVNVDENKPYYLEQFDVVCMNNTGYDELSQKLSVFS